MGILVKQVLDITANSTIYPTKNDVILTHEGQNSLLALPQMPEMPVISGVFGPYFLPSFSSLQGSTLSE